jgi:hypothetical protein
MEVRQGRVRVCHSEPIQAVKTHAPVQLRRPRNNFGFACTRLQACRTGAEMKLNVGEGEKVCRKGAKCQGTSLLVSKNILRVALASLTPPAHPLSQRL